MDIYIDYTAIMVAPGILKTGVRTGRIDCGI
jgi:hypothetical protein